ncbi:nickel pincer cofactor biosynthesis protein LarC [Nocardia farcinica]|uniref:nickel pincer cofactor biosynthesis protein LarC n=1 Tax=Nocardia farcinica TaxID=37329 RepID=UPI0037B65FEE
MRLAWIDATAGVSGDMVLGALLDAGAAPESVQSAIDAVVPGAVRVVRGDVLRCGMRACRVELPVAAADPPHRHWRDIRAMLADAPLPTPVRERAMQVFTRLAHAEGGVHGVPPDRVHFHEVGALDSIADVVGACAALHDLGVQRIAASAIAVGSGTVRGAHGVLPVPVPAVVAMTRGWQVLAGGDGELATPTGVALLTALAECTVLPPMLLDTVGVGAGTRDVPDRANVVRVLVGETDEPCASGDSGAAVVVEANVDDLDPRVWPTVLEHLLDHGADDAWLTPILMKKGRPAHTVHALTTAARADAVSEVLLRETSTIGLRRIVARKTALARTWVPVAVAGGRVRVKVALRHDLIIQATPEFDDAAELARATGRPLRAVLEEAVAAAVARGLVTGERYPVGGC